MTQHNLAEKIGTKQAGISRLENVNYSSWKTQTLRKIARALGVRLSISFETFGTLLDEAEQFGRQSLERPDFVSDPVFRSSGLGYAAALSEPSQTYLQSATDAAGASQSQIVNIVQGPWLSTYGQVGSVYQAING